MRFLFVSAWTVVMTCLYGTPWFITPCLLNKYRYMCGYFSKILWSAGARPEAEIHPSVKTDQPYVAVSNHRSHMDIPATAAAVPIRWHFVAKRSLFFIPIFSRGLKRLDMICLDRRSTKAAYAGLDAAASQIAQGRTVLMYSEGGISRDGSLQPFKKGAFHLAIRAQVPILPIVVFGSREVFDFRRARSKPGIIRVKVLEPVPTQGLTRKDLPELIELVRRVMIEAGADPREHRGASGR